MRTLRCVVEVIHVFYARHCGSINRICDNLSRVLPVIVRFASAYVCVRDKIIPRETRSGGVEDITDALARAAGEIARVYRARGLGF